MQVHTVTEGYNRVQAVYSCLKFLKCPILNEVIANNLDLIVYYQLSQEFEQLATG